MDEMRAPFWSVYILGTDGSSLRFPSMSNDQYVSMLASQISGQVFTVSRETNGRTFYYHINPDKVVYVQGEVVNEDV